MLCPACAADNPAANRFCYGCGAGLETRCPQCGAVAPVGANFCGQCGAALREAGPPAGSGGAVEGERRRVTVLFADTAGYTPLAEQLDPEDVHALMNRCFAVITDVVERLEGSINQYTGDGVMALFGAPLAIEDAPRRAVQAALDIQRALCELSRELEATRGLSVRMRIGLHTGMVVVGRIGDDVRMDYTAIGDTTNVAARLQQAAEPGHVLISGATQHLVAPYFDTVDRGELELKGHAAPVHAFEVVGARPLRARLQAAAERGLTPLVGRERELEVLLDLYDRAQRGEGQVALLIGDAGIGKSRLVYELRRRLAAAGAEALWLEGRCVSFGTGVPLLPVIEQLREHFEIDERDDDTEILAKVDAGLHRLGELEAHAPYLRYLLAVEAGEPDVARMEPAARRQRTFEALRALALRSVRARPAVFVFEDLQWSDRSTQEYLSWALDAVPGAPILVIGTYRIGAGAAFDARGFVTKVILHSLDERDALTMASAVLGSARVPAELRAAVLDKAEGVPLFIEEVSRTLLDLGAAPRGGGLTIPDTVEGIIMARLDRLGEHGKRTVQLASVIGRHFLKRLLERVAGMPQQLDGLLAELKRLEIVYEQGLVAEPAYVFKHAVIQDVAYGSLLLQSRRELHRAVGAAIEELYADRLPDHYAELAHHFLRGELWGKALDYASRAGGRAAHAGANREAVQHCADALRAAAELLPPPDPMVVARLHARRGALLGLLGEYEPAIDDYGRALALAERSEDRRAEAEILLGLSEVHLAYHRAEPAIVTCDRALAIAESIDDRALQAAVLATRANYVASWQGPVAEARRAARQALELTDDVADPRLRARTLTSLGAVLQWRGDLEACVPYLQEGVGLAKRSASSLVYGQGLFHLGNAALSRGRYAQAQRWYDELADYADSAQDRFWLVRTANLRGAVHLDLYDVAEAIRLCAEGDEVARRLSQWPEPRGHCLVKLAAAHRLRGDHGAAAAALDEANALLAVDAWARWRWHITLLRARAELALDAGRLDEAWEAASQSLEIATRSDSRKHIAHTSITLGEIAAAQERLPEAAHLLRGAVTLAEHIGAARELWLGCRALGGVLAQSGAEREAEGFLTEAAQTIEAIAGGIQEPRLRASFLAADPVRDVYRLLGRRPPPSVAASAKSDLRGSKQILSIKPETGVPG